MTAEYKLNGSNVTRNCSKSDDSKLKGSKHYSELMQDYQL